MTTPAIIGCGLAAFVIILALVGVWAVLSHEEEYQDDYLASKDDWGKW